MSGPRNFGGPNRRNVRRKKHCGEPSKPATNRQKQNNRFFSQNLQSRDALPRIQADQQASLCGSESGDGKSSGYLKIFWLALLA